MMQLIVASSSTQGLHELLLLQTSILCSWAPFTLDVHGQSIEDPSESIQRKVFSWTRSALHCYCHYHLSVFAAWEQYCKTVLAIVINCSSWILGIILLVANPLPVCQLHVSRYRRPDVNLLMPISQIQTYASVIAVYLPWCQLYVEATLSLNVLTATRMAKPFHWHGKTNLTNLMVFW